jgi:Ca2+-transporting ATPase
VPFLSAAFDTVPLPLAEWALVLALAASVMPVLELVKWMVRRGWFGPIP